MEEILQQLGEGKNSDVECIDRCRECIPDLSCFLLDVGTEERLCDDGEGELHHLVVHVEMMSIGPPRPGPICVFDHRLSISGDAIPMECRLHEPPLAEMEFPLACEKPLTEEAFGAHERPALGEVLLIGDENVSNEIRVVEEVYPPVRHLEEDDIPVFVSGLDHEWEPTARELDQHVTGKAGAWPRGSPAICSFARHRVSATSVIRAI